MADLSNLKPKDEDIVVTLVHPSTLDVLYNGDNEDSPMTITMYSPNSAEYKKVLHNQTNKRLKQMQVKRKKDVTAEELEESGLALMASTVKDWDITLDGKKPDFNVSNVKDVFRTYTWIQSQVNEAIEDSEAFT